MIYRRKFEIGVIQREINQLIKCDPVDFAKIKELVSNQYKIRKDMRDLFFLKKKIEKVVKLNQGIIPLKEDGRFKK